MRSIRGKMISLALAALYLALATAGDALHAVLPCQDSACAVGEPVCKCGHEHIDWTGAQRGNQSQATGGDRIEWRTSHPKHDASTCALCGVLGQLKVATSIAAPAAEIAAPIVDVGIQISPVRAHSVSRIYAARGPPMLSA